MLDITAVEVVLYDETAGNERIRGFASITISNVFVVHDLKLVARKDDGDPLDVMVFMPSRKLQDRCPRCAVKNPLLAKFCGHCGTRLASDRDAELRREGRKPYADVAHPIASAARAEIETVVRAAYRRKVAEAAQISESKS